MRSIATKVDRFMAYGKGSPAKKVTSHNSHVTNIKYISISSKPIATKLNKVMAYDIGPSRTKSHDSLITGS